MHTQILPLAPARPAGARYTTNLDRVPQLTEAERDDLREVAGKYPFRANDYYLSLIDWSNPDDPIRRLILPRAEELDDWGAADASNEAANTVARGVQHKYPDTVLLLCSNVCGGYCRYCFRKRLFTGVSEETSPDVSESIAYIAAHPEVTNVLLTGGDPLLLAPRRLREIIEQLRSIDHVRIIRLGSKMPAFDPAWLIENHELHCICARHSTAQKRMYLVTHFDHPTELTDLAIECVDRFIRDGVICVNQCPLIRGVNDDPGTLSALFRKLSWIGCPPYYVFQCRPTMGNGPYVVPIVRGWEIFREAMRHGAGLARRARFVMSHETGKIEIMAVDRDRIYARYLRAKDPGLRGRFMVYLRDETACWLDELVLAEDGGPPPMADEWDDMLYRAPA